MFSFLYKGNGPDVTDRVWLSMGAMQAGIGQWLRDNSNGMAAVWFRQDMEALRKTLPEDLAARVVATDSLTTESLQGKQLLVVGHYPLQSTEATFAEQLGLKKLLIFSALDSPLFKRFGGDKIIEVARGMGMKEQEGIEHFLVSSSIKKTQGKISDTVSNEMQATSEEEWMHLNLPQ